MRRAPGTGTIVPTRDGRYRARFPLATGERIPGTFDTREAAEGFLAAMADAARERNLAAVGGKTLRVWGREFFDRREKRGVRDVDGERRTWKLHVECARFVDWPLRRIKTRDVLVWRDGLREKAPTSPNGQPVASDAISLKRVKDTLGLLRLALEEAVQYGELRSSPAREVRAPRVDRERSSRDAFTFLSVEEQARLLAVVPEPERLVLQFAMGTGLRPGELAGLELRDVHHDGTARHVVVRHGKPPGRGGDRSTKSARVRRVPLFGMGLRAARAWLELLPTFAPANPYGLMFPKPNGAPRGPHRAPRFFKRRWSSWLREAKLLASDRADGLPVRWYDATRHTFATSLLNGAWCEAWRIEDVSAALGHADIALTQRHYARVMPDRLDAVARRAEATLIEGPKVTRRSPEPFGADLAELTAMLFATSKVDALSGTRGSNP